MENGRIWGVLNPNMLPLEKKGRVSRDVLFFHPFFILLNCQNNFLLFFK